MRRAPRQALRASLILLVAATGIARNGEAGDGAEDRVDFGSQIRPILSDSCFHCHGPDAEDRKAGLRLDVPEGAFEETRSGAVPVVPGDLDQSELIWRVTTDDEFTQMPPP